MIDVRVGCAFLMMCMLRYRQAPNEPWKPLTSRGVSAGTAATVAYSINSLLLV